MVNVKLDVCGRGSRSCHGAKGLTTTLLAVLDIGADVIKPEFVVIAAVVGCVLAAAGCVAATVGFCVAVASGAPAVVVGTAEALATATVGATVTPEAFVGRVSNIGTRDGSGKLESGGFNSSAL